MKYIYLIKHNLSKYFSIHCTCSLIYIPYFADTLLMKNVITYSKSIVYSQQHSLNDVDMQQMYMKEILKNMLTYVRVCNSTDLI